MHVLERTKNIIYGVDKSKLTNTRKKSRHLKNIFCNVMRAEKLNFPDDFFQVSIFYPNVA